MKLIIDSRRKRKTQESLQEKAERIAALLTRAADPLAASLVRILQEHTPLSYLLARPDEQIVALIREFTHFLEDRRGEAAIRFLSLEAGETLLLTNTPDAPYLLDSVQNVLTGQGIHFRVISHPILTVRRRAGRLLELGGVQRRRERESFIIIKLDGGEEKEATLCPALEEVLRAALLVHRDGRELSDRLRDLEQAPGMEEYREFWQWLQKGNFLPFSYRMLEVRREAAVWLVREREGSALGLPVDAGDLSWGRLDEADSVFAERLRRERPVMVEEIERLSPVHRSEPLSYLGFRAVTGPDEWVEHVFLGLFSQKSMDELAFNVPPLRRRLEQALAHLCIPRNCHDYRKTVEIFNSFPKVELFFLSQLELTEIVRSFTLLYRRGVVRAVAVSSLALRGLTIIVIMPRSFYAEEVPGRFEKYLRRLFGASSGNAKIIHISPDFLILHFGLQPAAREVRIDLDRLERGLTNLALPWEERLRRRFFRICGPSEGASLWERYAGNFSRGYRTLVHPRFALRDVRKVEQVLTDGAETLDLWGPFGAGEKHYRLQFYSLQESYLNELMPILENLNLWVMEEVDFALEVAGTKVFIKSFAVRPAVSDKQPPTALKEFLLTALAAVRRGEAENDRLNRLLVLTGLPWRDVDVLRGYRNYYLQLGSPHGKGRIDGALVGNSHIAFLLFRYFEARFRPEERWNSLRRREEEGLSPIRVELAAALETVADINEDKILRALFNLIDSTVRTNFFLRRDRPDYFFSFKISAIGIIDMPAPRPLFEIYVHAASMEGIHLRGDKVARGGIRWSDRPDDFRTEILGLMKTQMTKNALIVPVGSKGGFIVKLPFSTREEGAAISREAYQTLMRGLLDLTDNRVREEVVRPAGVVAYDEDDPYLVVAADKGTAHLSDTANAVSRDYGFWLEDAFASGGSHGYDHKELGITARGAWECVKRHFREMGRNIQEEPFTVVGIGDMSGDVFGNGMLLSRCIRLRGAFDHRHIFIDPDPDPEVSFRERQRLAALPRSSWGDYDRSLLSPGGGVFPRDAKDIRLAPEVRRWLGVRQEGIDGPGLIRLLLMAETDLLWNGGIGVYVRGDGEKNEEVGDKANDSVRIEAGQVRAKVVGEGGNLGFTQQARIEYALNGGRINTDAVDNSGGVDCSDHEVNLKILLRLMREEGRIASDEERNQLLLEIRDDVCAAVLADNDRQSLCLSLDQIRCGREVEAHLELADRLSAAGLLDRRSEFLPPSREILGRPDRTLTRPELAILMAYAKMHLYQSLLESELPEREEIRQWLAGYFPPLIRKRFGDRLAAHPLAREIAATCIVNLIVDQAGSAFANHLGQQTGASPVRMTAAYLTFDRVVDGPELRQAVRALDNLLPARRQYEILLELEDTVTVLCRWSLKHGMAIAPGLEMIGRLRDKIAEYRKILSSILPEEEWRKCLERQTRMEEEGFPSDAAARLATLPHLEDFLPVAELVVQTGGEFHSLAHTYHEVREAVGIPQILRRMREAPVRDKWDRMALNTLRNRFQTLQFDLARAVWGESEGNLEAFFSHRRGRVKFFRSLEAGLRETTPSNFHPFSVLAGALEDLLS